MKGRQRFIEDWEEGELERLKEAKFDPDSVKFYPVAGRASAFISSSSRL